MEAKEFKRKRMSLGLIQTELAELLDVKPNTVSRYETGLLAIPKTVELALEAIGNRMDDRDKKFARIDFIIAIDDEQKPVFEKFIKDFLRVRSVGWQGFDITKTDLGFLFQITFGYFPDLAFIDELKSTIHINFGDKLNLWKALRHKDIM